MPWRCVCCHSSQEKHHGLKKETPKIIECAASFPSTQHRRALRATTESELRKLLFFTQAHAILAPPRSGLKSAVSASPTRAPVLFCTSPTQKRGGNKRRDDAKKDAVNQTWTLSYSILSILTIEGASGRKFFCTFYYFKRFYDVFLERCKSSFFFAWVINSNQTSMVYQNFFQFMTLLLGQVKANETPGHL